MGSSTMRQHPLLESWWILLTFSLFLNWAGFLYAGFRARNPAWVVAGVLYSVPIALNFWLDNTSGPHTGIYGASVILILAGTVVSIVHAFRIRREFVARVNARPAPRMPRISACLERYILDGDRVGLQRIVGEVGHGSGLPRWPITNSLLKSSEELLELRASAPIAKQVGVPGATVDLLTEESGRVAGMLGSVADRIMGAGELNLPPERMKDALRREQARLDSIAAGVMELRNRMGALTVSGSSEAEVRDVVQRLRQVSGVADEVGHLITED